ncbi:MAG: ankyrin repeat domain-containing protein [Cellulosilyticaceae bacterium]
MENKERKPISISSIVAIFCIAIGIGVWIKVSTVSGILIVILGLVIGGMNIWLMQCSMIFLGSNKHRGKKVSIYKEFATFYLHDRRLTYSKQTFKTAVENNWYDVVTMCVLLGIRKALTEKEQEMMVTYAIENNYLLLFATLLKGSFKSDYTPYEDGTPLIFLALDKENPGYLQALLKQNVATDVTDVTGLTPIFKVIKDNRSDLAKLLIANGVDLATENIQGLTPLFSAVAEENIEICQMILNKLPKKIANAPIKFEKIEHKFVLDDKQDYTERDLLVEMVSSGDKQTLNTLKGYFKDKTSHRLTVESGVELYTRLSYLGGNYEKHTRTTKEKEVVYPESDCLKDLLKRVEMRYKLTDIGSFKLGKIYKTPKCIESIRIPCKTCEGNGKVPCGECAGSGNVNCSECGGTGATECPKCHGTERVSCDVLQQYLECKDCKDKHYICGQCLGRGIEICPTCGGTGGKKCSCPKNKQTKCPHCDNGYTEVKRGEYRKCRHCSGNGKICILCNNTGWINTQSGNKRDVCERCEGTGKIKCRVCKGNKRIKCTKAYTEPCDCHKGNVTCTKCSGGKKQKCERCNGTGKEACLECTDGFVYENIYLDFECENMLNKEAILSKQEEPYLVEFKEKAIESALNNSGYISSVYTYKNLRIEPKDISVGDYYLNEAMKKFLNEKENKGITEILEVMPLYYQMITIEKAHGDRYRCLIINNKFFKGYKLKDS